MNEMVGNVTFKISVICDSEILPNLYVGCDTRNQYSIMLPYTLSYFTARVFFSI